MKPKQIKKQISDVISIRSDAFIQIIEETISYIKSAHGFGAEHRWVGGDTAKSLLGITSNSSLQKLRDEGKIRFSQPMHKVILYDRYSLVEFIEQHSKKTF